MSVRADRLIRRVRRMVAPDPMSDAALLSRFVADRDTAAFAALVDRHGPMVLRVCRRVLGNGHDAEDALQATFLVLARRAGAIQPPDALAGWLHGVAWRVAIGARPACARRRQACAADLSPADRHPDPLTELTAREAVDFIYEEVRHLPEAYRLPVILCCLEGLSQEEAARRLACAPGAVKGRLERGRARLRDRLARRGLTLPAALAIVTVAQAAPAALSAALAERAMQSALAFAIGPTTTIPDPVAVLAERVLHGMTAAPWKAAAAFLLVCVALAGGAVALAYHGAGPEAPADEPRAALRQRPAPDVEDLAPRDAFGDALPPGAIARLGTLRFRHWFPLGDVAYSPDGKLLATAGTNDRQIRLWDAVTGRMLASTPGEHAIVFTPGGERLFHAGGDVNAKARVLDIVHRKEEPSLIPAVNSQSLAMSPDGRAFAMDLWSAKPPHEVAAYDAATGRIRLRLGSHQGPVGAVRYSPDGKVIATAGDEAVIRLLDAATGKLLRRLDGHKAVKGYYQNMLAIAFSPDSKQLVSGGADKAVRLWDVGTGKELRRFGVHKGCVLCVAFTPDGKHVLTGGFDEPLRLWDVDSGKEVQRFPKRSEWAWRIAFAPKANTFAAVHWGCQAPRFWDVDTGREVPTHVAPESEVTGIVFSRDGRMVSTAGGDRVVRHWDVTTGRQLGRWDNLPPLLNCLERSPDGQVVATGDAAGIITLRQADSGQELRRMRGPKGWVVNLAFAPDGKTLASACDGGDVILWDVATGVELRRCKGHKESAAGVAFTPDGMTLASVDVNQTTVIIWQVDTGRELRRLKTRDLQNHAVAISPDGRLLLVAATGEKPVQLWELATGRELPPLVLPGNEQRMFALAFAPDGRTLATGGEDGVVRLWEMVSGQERRHFTGHTGWAHRVRFAPDGKRLASASNDTTAVVWDVVTPSAAERKRAAALTAKQAEALWSELAGGAESADRAMRVLAAAPTRTVALLQAKLKPMAKVDPAHVQRLIAQLDDAEFDLRERAAKELAALDEVALPALRTTESRSLEQRRRIETLLNRTSLVANPRIRQALRAVEILERIGTADARRILATLASGAPEARITMEARASTERLARRNASAP